MKAQAPSEVEVWVPTVAMGAVFPLSGRRGGYLLDGYESEARAKAEQVFPGRVGARVAVEDLTLRKHPDRPTFKGVRYVFLLVPVQRTGL